LFAADFDLKKFIRSNFTLPESLPTGKGDAIVAQIDGVFYETSSSFSFLFIYLCAGENFHV
jgi:hypothetical protein